MLGDDLVGDKDDVVGAFPFKGPGDGVGAIVQLPDGLLNSAALFLIYIAVVVDDIGHHRFADPCQQGYILSGHLSKFLCHLAAPLWSVGNLRLHFLL